MEADGRPHLGELVAPYPSEETTVIIEENFTVQAPPEAVSDFFLDIDRVSKCVPGVGEVRTVGDGEYEATLSVRVGPVAASFLGSVTLDASGAPKRLKAAGQGKDRASGSRVEVKFNADLVEVGEGVTEVRSEADVVVRGRLGQFGTSVIKATSHELVKEFSACVNASLATQASAAPVAEDSAGAADQTQNQPVASAAATPAAQVQAAPLKVLPLMGKILLGLLTAGVQRVAAWVRGLRRSSR